MAHTMNYSSKTLGDVKFSANQKGYNALEVDLALDQVIGDYQFYEKYYSDSRSYIEKLEKEIKNLKERVHDKEVEMASLKNKYQGIKPGTVVTDSNINLIKRISRLEEALYKKGVDPTKI